MSFVLSGLFLLVVVGGIAVAVRFLFKRKGGVEGTGQDLLPYFLLAIAVGITVFSLTQLGRAAFPGANLVGSSSQQVATALAGLVVGVPFSIVLWRRQTERRKQFPASPGWPLYLAVVEAVLTTSLVVVVIQLLDWLLLDGSRSSWTDVIVLGASFAFHEWAANEDPPGSDAAELPRVVGSAIGLIASAIGVTGVLWGLLERIYGSLFATAGNLDILPFVLVAAVGVPLWTHRWLRRWPTETAMPRKTWLVVTTVVGAFTVLGAAVAVGIAVVTYLAGDVGPAASHFELLPGAFSVGIVAFLVWMHHRTRTAGLPMAGGDETVSGGLQRNLTEAAYQYIMAALGLSFSIGSLTTLSAVAFGSDFVGADRPQAAVSLAVVTVTAVAVWLWFWSRCQSFDRPTESMTPPRRAYVVGMAVIAGLTATQAVIATLVVVFQLILGLDPSRMTLVTEGTLAVLSTGATLHLLQVNRADRALQASVDVITPFQVTIICSHPGGLAALFPKVATTKVIYRADDAGIVTDEMAAQIVAAVGTTSSIVWVRDGGFEVASAR